MIRHQPSPAVKSAPIFLPHQTNNAEKREACTDTCTHQQQPNHVGWKTVNCLTQKKAISCHGVWSQPLPPLLIALCDAWLPGQTRRPNLTQTNEQGRSDSPTPPTLKQVAFKPVDSNSCYFYMVQAQAMNIT